MKTITLHEIGLNTPSTVVVDKIKSFNSGVLDNGNPFTSVFFIDGTDILVKESSERIGQMLNNI